jgi:outer membrane receptor for ferrienterochelin and colicins
MLGAEVVDAAAGKANYRVPDSGFEIRGGIDNVLDEEVDTALGSDPGPFAYIGLSYRI